MQEVVTGQTHKLEVFSAYLVNQRELELSVCDIHGKDESGFSS